MSKDQPVGKDAIAVVRTEYPCNLEHFPGVICAKFAGLRPT